MGLSLITHRIRILKGGNGGNFLGGFMVLYYLKLAIDHKNIHFRPQKGS